MIKILLGQKQDLFRSALSSALCMHTDLRVVAETERGEEVPRIVSRTQAEVIVLDHGLPSDLPIPDLCGLLVPAHSVLVVTDKQRCVIDGADLAKLAPSVGLVQSNITVEQLIEAIQDLVRGRAVFDGELAVAALTGGSSPLTCRERQVLRTAADGKPLKDVAASLFLSPGTVRNYLSRINMKTGARSRLEAVRIASESGWI